MERRKDTDNESFLQIRLHAEKICDIMPRTARPGAPFGGAAPIRKSRHGGLYTYTSRYASVIVRFRDASPKMRSENEQIT